MSWAWEVSLLLSMKCLMEKDFEEVWVNLAVLYYIIFIDQI